MDIVDYEHQQVLEEARLRREAAERSHGTSAGCPWGCDGSGWRVVEGDEDQEPRPLEVVVSGALWTPCECNCRLVWCDGRYQTEAGKDKLGGGKG